jgi:hypothetical protein
MLHFASALSPSEAACARRGQQPQDQPASFAAIRPLSTFSEAGRVDFNVAKESWGAGDRRHWGVIRCASWQNADASHVDFGGVSISILAGAEVNRDFRIRAACLSLRRLIVRSAASYENLC